jgi:hypothetical protein
MEREATIIEKDYIMTTTETQLNISKKTLELLKNFSTINSNILIRPGNKITTISGVKNIMAEAEVDENFDSEFGVWDLSRFLGTISLFESPEFEFNDKYMTISDGKGASVKYFYCEPKLLTTVNKEITMPDIVVTFSLTEKIFADVMRASSVLQLSDICVRSAGDSIEMVALNKGDTTSNHYAQVVGQLDTPCEFEFYFKSENLKMLPGNYNVSLTESVVAKFENTNTDLRYWIALESDSNYKG